jgi:N-acyl-phosphatidylethanolamine-hydrolysing phospholipase D
VPLGLAAWFQASGLEKVTELDWWQSAVLGPVRFHSVPVQHFSQRTPFNRNQSLWCGWVLETPAGKIFFGGDTGYSQDFQEIGARFGPLRLALLPIGGYQPRWFMKSMHLNPPEAVRVHRDLRARVSIGMHWGTFKLTDEPLGEPPVYLQQTLREAGIPPEQFITLGIGETRSFQ